MKTVNIFGFPFVVSDKHEFAQTIVDRISRNVHDRILPTTLHEMAASRKSDEIRRALNSFDFLTMDGMPFVFISKLKGYWSAKRVYGPELMLEIIKQGEKKKIKHYLYGGTPESLKKLSHQLKEKFPNAKIVGQYSPPFRALKPAEEHQVTEKIKKTKPDIVWIGLGGEKQVLWIHHFFERLNSTCIGVGAAFDFLAGVKPQAPPEFRNVGLEWLYRLITEPKRLWKRYLIDIPSFLLFSALFSMKKPFFKIAVLFVSVFVTLLLAEVYLFYKGYQIRDHSWIFSNEEFVQNGEYRNFFTLDRGEIFKPRPNTSINVNYWETDDKGFRLNPEHENIQNPKHKILVIGDSFAYGHNVSHSEAWAALLEKQLRDSGKDVRVDNAGVPATGTDQQFNRIRKRVQQENYDVVLWMISFNDMIDSNNSCLFKPENENRGYVQIPAFFNVAYLNGFLTKYLPSWFSQRTRLGNYITTINYKGKDLYTFNCSKIVKDEELVKPYFEKLSYLLTQTKTDLQSKNIKLVVFLGPSQSYFDQEYLNDSYEIQFLSQFTKVFKEIGIPNIDINTQLASRLSPTLTQFRQGSSSIKNSDVNNEYLNNELFLDEGTETPYGSRHMNAKGNHELEKMIFNEINEMIVD